MTDEQRQGAGGPEIENLMAEERTYPPDGAFTAQANAGPDLYLTAEDDYEAFWADLAANWYPAAGRLAGSQSRTYQYVLGVTETLDRHLRLANWLPPREGTAPGAPQLDAWSGK